MGKEEIKIKFSKKSTKISISKKQLNSKVKGCLNIVDLPSAVLNKGGEILLIKARPSD